MSSYTQWIPFQMACRLHVLQQGSLNVGNTQQNIANLLALCITEANAGANFAKWRVGRVAGCNPATQLRVMPAKVPGFLKPINS